MHSGEPREREKREVVVLGIDAGTSGLRAGLFTLQGEPVGFSDQNYQTYYYPHQPGWAEQNPLDWWQALVKAVKGAISTSSIDPARIIGLAIDAPCNIFLVDEEGRALTPSLLWMDLRATMQAKQLTATQSYILRYCGGEVPAEWPLPKALWLKQNEPKLWDKATYLVEQLSWLTWKLTGEWVVSQNSAAAKWHYYAPQHQTRPANGVELVQREINTDKGGGSISSEGDNSSNKGTGWWWPTQLLASVDLSELITKVPGKVLPMGAKAGELSSEAAAELGLRPNIAVSVSGIDAYAGMVGVNALKPGRLALITGTSTCQITQSPHEIINPSFWGPFPDAVNVGEWSIEAGQASTGGTVRWLLDLVGRNLTNDIDTTTTMTAPASAGEEDRYATLEKEASKVLPGADGLTLLDYWQGSRTPIKDPMARGTIWGLNTSHTAGHLLRAVYEGTAYGNRSILEKLGKSGVPIEQIIACGGGTRSRLWLQILADVAGVPLTLTTVPDAVSLGSAICGAVGAGLFEDLQAAGQAMVKTGTTIEPNIANKAVYDEGYDLYQETYQALAPLFHKRQSRD